MSAKEVLESIQLNRERIEHLYQRQQSLNDYGMRAIDYAKPKVQSSPESSIVETMALRNQERQQKLENEINKLALKIDDTLQLIEEFTTNRNYSKLLFLKYSEGKTMKEISVIMQYDYRYLCTMHTGALKEFDKYLKENQISL